MVVFRLLERSLGLVSTLILARLLMPADFGLVAMAMSVVALLELASAFSLDVPLIQRQSPTRAHYDTAWTLNLLFGAGCASAMALLAFPAAAFYGEDRLGPVMLVLSAGWFLQGFENIGIVNFRRTMNFRRETAFLLSKKLVGFCVTLGLAFGFRTYWALVAGIVAGRAAGVALSYLLEPFRPRLSLAARADLLSMSGWLFLNNLLYFGTTRLSHFIIGRVNGAQALGLYTIAAELAYLPQSELVAPINRALFPGFSRMQEDVAGLRRGFVTANSIIALLVFPAGVGVASIAAYLVPVVLGPRWIDAVPIMQVLAIAGTVAALTSNTYSAYLALGRARVTTWILVLELTLMAVGMLLLSRWYGVLGVAYAELIAIAIGASVGFLVLLRTLRLRARELLVNLIRPALASAAMAAVIASLGEWLGGPGTGLAGTSVLLLLMVAGAATYVLLVAGLWVAARRPPGAEQLILDQVRARLRVAPPAPREA